MGYNAVLSIKVVTPPAAEPVTLEEAKEYMRVDYGDEDDLITGLIKSSRLLIERHYNVGIISKGLEVVLRNEYGGMDIPYWPASDVIGVNHNGAAIDNLLISGDYIGYKDCEPYTISYTSGYELADVPEDFKTAIKAQVLYNFENRGNDMANKPNICPQTEMIMASYSRNSMGFII